MRFMNCDLLTIGIDNEYHIRNLFHVANTVEVGLQLSKFLAKQNLLFLRKNFHATIRLHCFKLFHALNARANSNEVGQHTAKPASVYVRHTATVCCISNRLLSLLFGAYEQNRATLFSATRYCGVSSVQTVEGFLQIDDVDVATITEDIGLHLRIPTTGLMTEVGACIKQGLDSNFCHVFSIR